MRLSAAVRHAHSLADSAQLTVTLIPDLFAH
jgi:hypothetical protein